VGAGDVSHACRLLGRWIELEGKIVSGAGRGRTMQAPTLNLQSDNELIPKIGVYVSRISLDGGPMLEAVTNIGVRPTFNETDLTIETFVLNDGVPPDPGVARLDLIHRLRDERKFESPDELRNQIAIDVRAASRMHRKLKP
jgi:riboflavin kinase/FMN adenylyltransferase